MRQIYIILITLFWSLSASCQELPDSAKLMAEMEDSISGMTIRPVENPKELLDSIITQLLRDWEKKSGVAHWYRVENRTFPFAEHPTYPVVSSRLFPGESGIVPRSIGAAECFSFEGPVKLSRADSAGIMFNLSGYFNYSPILQFISVCTVSYNKSNREIFEKLMSMYDVKVYSITDESGRGVYRVNYTPNRKITSSNWRYYEFMVTGLAYFDCKTLRIKQAKGDISSCWNYPKLTVTPGNSYQIDYEMEGEIPVLKRSWYGSKEEKPPGAGVIVEKLE